MSLTIAEGGRAVRCDIYTRKSVTERLEHDYDMPTRDLGGLVELGASTRSGERRYARYELNIA